MTPEDIEQVVAALAPVIEHHIAGQMDGVHQAIESLRDEFSQTVAVLDGNDQAVVAEVQRMKQTPPAELVNIAAEAWDRFIRAEAAHLGLRFITPKE